MTSISVIVPVYNINCHYLQECYNSIINQTFTDYETIIVDDGSEESTADFCDKLASSDSRFRVIHKKNGGVSSARNVGLSEAQGEYVIFLDPDDWWEKDLLEKVYDTAKRYHADSVAFGHFLDRQDGVTPVPIKENMEKTIVLNPDEKNELIGALLNTNKRKYPGFIASACLQLIKRECIEEIKFHEDLSRCEDLMFDLELVPLLNKLVFLNQCFYHYRMVSDSSTNRFFPDVEVGYEALIEYIYRVIKDEARYHEDFGERIMSCYLSCIRQDYFNQENPEKYFIKKRRWLGLVKQSAFAKYKQFFIYEEFRRRSFGLWLTMKSSFEWNSFFILNLYIAFSALKRRIKKAVTKIGKAI